LLCFFYVVSLLPLVVVGRLEHARPSPFAEFVVQLGADVGLTQGEAERPLIFAFAFVAS
jgi:hypothetical protein